MALLRQCLQELRTKQHEWDAPAAGWPAAKLAQQQTRVTPAWMHLHGDRRHDSRGIASHRATA